jgi:hypothetical protein
MNRLQISLFGPFEVTLDGKPITRFGADTAQAARGRGTCGPRQRNC